MTVNQAPIILFVTGKPNRWKTVSAGSLGSGRSTLNHSSQPGNVRPPNILLPKGPLRNPITKRKRVRMLQILQVILNEANKLGVRPDVFLLRSKDGGVGENNLHRPEVYASKLKQNSLL